MKSKKNYLIFVLVILLLGTNGPRIYKTMFSESKCQKMVRQINQIDQISLELWKNYKRSRSDGIYLEIQGVVDVHSSKLKGLGIMKVNQECFDVATYARILKSYSSERLIISLAKKAIWTGRLQSWRQIDDQKPISLYDLYLTKVSK